MSSISIGKRRLARVLRGSGDVISIDAVMAALSMGRSEAAKLLSRWVGQGWLRRVGRGAYVPAALDSLDSKHVLEDPWVLVPALFSPAYIGGRTASEYWDLTEQLFRDIVVMTGRPVRRNDQQHHGTRFTVHHVPEKRIFGTRTLWRGATKVLVSDVHRTIVDMLGSPSLGGGIQHVADCLASYLNRSDRNDRLLLEYATRIGNGAAFKRLGFLAEQYPDTSELIAYSKLHLTTGKAKLDAALSCTRLITRWHLWVPPRWVPGKTLDQ